MGGLAYLDPYLRAIGYFEPLIRHLVTRLGYQIGTSLRGAPFDWRQAPDGFSTITAGAAYQNASYFDRLQALVEVRYAPVPALRWPLGHNLPT